MKYNVLLLTFITLISCQIERDKKEPSKTEQTPEQETVKSEFNLNNEKSLIGQRFEEVKPALEKAKIRFRVLEEDGESFPATMDYIPERLNFVIQKGKVVSVTKG